MSDDQNKNNPDMQDDDFLDDDLFDDEFGDDLGELGDDLGDFDLDEGDFSDEDLAPKILAMMKISTKAMSVHMTRNLPVMMRLMRPRPYPKTNRR